MRHESTRMPLVRLLWARRCTELVGKALGFGLQPIRVTAPLHIMTRTMTPTGVGPADGPWPEVADRSPRVCLIQLSGGEREVGNRGLGIVGH